MHQAKRNQHRQQHAQRSHEVDDRWAQVQQVIAQHQQGYTIPHDVAEQFEEREHQRQHHERRQHHHEIKQEIPQDHVVEQQRKLRTKYARARQRLFKGPPGPLRAFRLGFDREAFPQRLPPRGQPTQVDRRAIYPVEQENTSEQEDRIRHPDSDGRG